jgi:hypothetical protein
VQKAVHLTHTRSSELNSTTVWYIQKLNLSSRRESENINTHLAKYEDTNRLILIIITTYRNIELQVEFVLEEVVDVPTLACPLGAILVRRDLYDTCPAGFSLSAVAHLSETREASRHEIHISTT